MRSYYITKDTKYRNSTFDMVINSEDQLRLEFWYCIQKKEVIDFISLPKSHFGAYVNSSVTKFISIAPELFSENLIIEWRD